MGIEDMIVNGKWWLWVGDGIYKMVITVGRFGTKTGWVRGEVLKVKRISESICIEQGLQVVDGGGSEYGGAFLLATLLKHAELLVNYLHSNSPIRPILLSSTYEFYKLERNAYTSCLST